MVVPRFHYFIIDCSGFSGTTTNNNNNKFLLICLFYIKVCLLIELTIVHFVGQIPLLAINKLIYEEKMHDILLSFFLHLAVRNNNNDNHVYKK